MRFMFSKEWFIDVNYICKTVCIPENYLTISYIQIKQRFLSMAVYCLLKEFKINIYYLFKKENNNDKTIFLNCI